MPTDASSRPPRRSFLLGLGAAAAVAGVDTLLAGCGRGAKTTSVDVLIYGATPAGVAALIAATRGGASCLLVAGLSPVGGMMTNGLSHSDVGDPAVIGGLARQFFLDIGREYGQSGPAYDFEPGVATTVFGRLIGSHRDAVTPGSLQSVHVTGGRITGVTLVDGRQLRARCFIDCSYEGDLTHLAGVRTAVGRDPAAAHGESLAGFSPDSKKYPIKPGLRPQLATLGFVNPYPATLAPHAGDGRVMAYCYRLCLSSEKSNQRPWTAPGGYHRDRYAPLLDFTDFSSIFSRLAALPNHKFDLNGGGTFDIDYVGGNTGYLAADRAQRIRIAAEHRRYQQGLLYFCATDRAVSAPVREAANAHQPARDEWERTAGWPAQLYVREGRRLLGQYTLTQSDVMSRAKHGDSVGRGSYSVDCHAVQRMVTPNGANLTMEGALFAAIPGSYQIPWRTLVPAAVPAGSPTGATVNGTVTNLLSPVTLSATHVAFASVRMEPQFMMLGEAAGAAAAQVAAGPARATSDGDLTRIDVPALQRDLRSHGAIL